MHCRGRAGGTGADRRGCDGGRRAGVERLGGDQRRTGRRGRGRRHGRQEGPDEAGSDRERERDDPSKTASPPRPPPGTAPAPAALPTPHGHWRLNSSAPPGQSGNVSRLASRTPIGARTAHQWTIQPAPTPQNTRPNVPDRAVCAPPADAHPPIPGRTALPRFPLAPAAPSPAIPALHPPPSVLSPPIPATSSRLRPPRLQSSPQAPDPLPLATPTPRRRRHSAPIADGASPVPFTRATKVLDRICRGPVKRIGSRSFAQAQQNRLNLGDVVVRSRRSHSTTHPTRPRTTLRDEEGDWRGPLQLMPRVVR